MKRINIICGLIAASITSVFAQNDDPLTISTRALRMSMNEAALGTARYSGMAGAMSALGGDGSAVKDNPAALGIYRKSDLGFTANVNVDNQGNANFNVNNFSTIFNFGNRGNTNGYVTSSLGVAYNRLTNFNRATYTNGFEIWNDEEGNEYENPYSSSFFEDNGSGIWNFGYGLNISNKVFAGLSVNAISLSYSQMTEPDFGDYECYRYDVDGGGWNLGLGLIVKPTDFMRIGASFTTPTRMKVTESREFPMRDYDGNLMFDRDGYTLHTGYGYDYTDAPAEYKIQSPMKAQLGLGFVIAKRALVGVDYSAQNFSKLKLKDYYGHQMLIEKAIANDNFTTMHTLKLGTEVQIAKGFAARAGFAVQSSPTETDACAVDDLKRRLNNNGLYVPYVDDYTNYSYSIPRASNYFTLGAGYHGKHFYCDLAYVNKRQKEDFYEWQSAIINKDEEIEGWNIDPISQTIKTHNIMCTVGVKF